jgi:hypothetical protein
MSTVLEPAKTPQPSIPVGKPELPDASVLEDRTPEWIRTSPTSALFMLLIGVVFILMANRPLWHTDLWDHLNYGQNIIETHEVSDTEPLLHLCRGVRMINIPWLAQVGMAALNDRVGLTGLQFAYGLTIALCMAVLAWRSVKLSHSAIGGIACLCCVLQSESGSAAGDSSATVWCAVLLHCCGMDVREEQTFEIHMDRDCLRCTCCGRMFMVHFRWD